MKRNAIALALLVITAGVSGALDIDAASGRFGIAIINNQSGVTGTVNPVITNTLGGSIVVSFAKDFILTVQPGLDFYWTQYEWNDGRAVPTPPDTGEGNNAFVLGFLLDLPVTATFRFSDRVGAAILPET